MVVTVPLNRITLRPGSAIAIADLDWAAFQRIAAELGDDRHTRLTYYQGQLEIVSPLARHERPHRLIGYLVTALLDARNLDWEDFGSTRFERENLAGLEPDTCFYVANAGRVRDCQGRVDVAQYPPPDLAIEADVTSKTSLAAYAALGVPEVWIYADGLLKIFVLDAGQYQPRDRGLLFPDLDLPAIVTAQLAKAQAIGSARTIREFRQSLQ